MADRDRVGELFHLCARPADHIAARCRPIKGGARIRLKAAPGVRSRSPWGISPSISRCRRVDGCQTLRAVRRQRRGGPGGPLKAATHDVLNATNGYAVGFEDSEVTAGVSAFVSRLPAVALFRVSARLFFEVTGLAWRSRAPLAVRSSSCCCSTVASQTSRAL